MCAIFLRVEAVLFAKDTAVMASKVPVLKYDVLVSLCHLTTPSRKSSNPPSLIQNARKSL
jgi:hypothetical protein